MAKKPWERNRSKLTTNTNGAVHESSTYWFKLVDSGAPLRRTRPARPVGTIDVDARALELAAELDLPTPASTSWARLPGMWGRCNTATRELFIAHAAAEVPAWVLDGIIVHELAHLVDPTHGTEFKTAVNRYHLAREVDGYLAAVQYRDWGVDAVPHQHRQDHHP